MTAERKSDPVAQWPVRERPVAGDLVDCLVAVLADDDVVVHLDDGVAVSPTHRGLLTERELRLIAEAGPVGSIDVVVVTDRWAGSLGHAARPAASPAAKHIPGGRIDGIASVCQPQWRSIVPSPPTHHARPRRPGPLALARRTRAAAPSIIDVLDQLEELATLLRRGLLSRHEFDRQKRTLLSSWG